MLNNGILWISLITKATGTLMRPFSEDSKALIPFQVLLFAVHCDKHLRRCVAVSPMGRVTPSVLLGRLCIAECVSVQRYMAC
jgi:hypothetical protein